VAGCKPGKRLLSADAEGFAATTLEVDLAADSEPFRLTLERGHLLRLRVVNSQGQPVPNTSVWLNTLITYRPIDSAAPAAPPAQIEFHRQTDGDGRLEWNSAPDGELDFVFSASGYMRVDDVKVRADGQEHTVTLSPALTISGTVRDSSSGQPIPQFRIVTGWPVRNPLDQTTSPHWSPIDRFWMRFKGGKFHHVYEEPVVGGTDHPEFMFKFEADGYAPAVTRVVKADEKDVRFDIALRPAPESVITVLSANGRPAANVDVGLVSPGALLQLVPGGFSHDNVQSGGAVLLTDERGHFKMPPDAAITRVIAASAEGYAEVPAAALAAEPTLQLQPWGRLEGTFLSNGQGAADRAVLFQYGAGDFDAVSSDFQAYQTKTDSAGHFVFAQVPPGRHTLVELVPTQVMPGGMGWVHKPLQEVEIRSGETTTVTLAGCKVIARPTWPAGLTGSPAWTIEASLATESPQPPEEAKADPAAMKTWRARPEIRAALRKARHFAVTSGPDGTVAAADVPPGEYVLSVNLVEKLTDGGERKIRASARVPVTVPTDPPAGVLDLGEIALNPAE